MSSPDLNTVSKCTFLTSQNALILFAHQMRPFPLKTFSCFRKQFILLIVPLGNIRTRSGMQSVKFI